MSDRRAIELARSEIEANNEVAVSEPEPTAQMEEYHQGRGESTSSK